MSHSDKCDFRPVSCRYAERGQLGSKKLGGVKIYKKRFRLGGTSESVVHGFTAVLFHGAAPLESRRIRHVLIRCKLQPSKNQEKTHVTCLQPSVMHCILHVIILVHKLQDAGKFACLCVRRSLPVP